MWRQTMTSIPIDVHNQIWKRNGSENTSTSFRSHLYTYVDIFGVIFNTKRCIYLYILFAMNERENGQGAIKVEVVVIAVTAATAIA